jgi:hypothetical protein
MSISRKTRRDIFDELRVQHIRWWGTLEEAGFLSRLYDLTQLPSNDPRFSNAEGDIRQHRDLNSDWPDDWVYDDGRFELMSGPDEVFLDFLCEVVHPVVRKDQDEGDRLVHLGNEYLAYEGWKLVPGKLIAGRPIYTYTQIDSAIEQPRFTVSNFDDLTRNPESLIATLANFFLQTGNLRLSEVLSASLGQIQLSGSDSWDGGSWWYLLILQIPTDLYASIRNEVDELGKTILTTTQEFLQQFPSHAITQVVIQPALVAPAGWRRRGVALPSNEMIAHELSVWGFPGFRLFISHVASHKKQVSELRCELSKVGISGFVAHVDIEPTKEWQDEIWAALRTAEALVALITADFHGSNWTDQETGIALGRDKLVVSVKIGAAPYGFLGKSQALPGTLEKPQQLAFAIARALARNPRTSDSMRESLVAAIESAADEDVVSQIAAILAECPNSTREQAKRILATIDEWIFVSDPVRVIIDALRRNILETYPDLKDQPG